MDEDLIYDAMIGQGSIQVDKIIQKADELWVELRYRGRTVGEILVKGTFSQTNNDAEKGKKDVVKSQIVEKID